MEFHEAFIKAAEISAPELAREQSSSTSPSVYLVHVQGDTSWVGHVCSIVAEPKEGMENNITVTNGFIVICNRRAASRRSESAEYP